MSRVRGRLERLLLWGLLLVAFAVFVRSTLTEINAIETSPVRYDMDEVYWAGEAYYFKLFFLDFDLTNDAWSGFWPTFNPPLVGYIYGFALMVSGHPITDTSLTSNFNLNWTNPARLFANTPPEVIRVCRVTAYVFGLLTAGLIFGIASFLGNRWLGIVALFVLGRDWLLLRYFYRAMSEPIVIFLICLFVLVCLRFYRKDRRSWGAPHHRLLALVAISLSIALLTLAKPNGPLAGIAFALVGLVYCGFRAYARSHDGLLRPREAWRGLADGLLNVAAAGVLSIALVVAFNPYLHPDPPARAAKTLAVWRQHFVSPHSRTRDQALHGLSERVAFVSKHCFPMSFKARVRPTAWRREMLRLANIGVLLMGVFFMAREGILRSARARLLAPQLIFLILAFVYVASLVCWLPRKWPRYVLVLHPFVLVLQSAVIWLAIDRSLHALCRRMPSLSDRLRPPSVSSLSKV